MTIIFTNEDTGIEGKSDKSNGAVWIWMNMLDDAKLYSGITISGDFTFDEFKQISDRIKNLTEYNPNCFSKACEDIRNLLKE